jgi:hypothetical protein
MRVAFASVGVDMSDDAWATAFADHWARCGEDALVHTAHSWIVTALWEIISEVRGALKVGVEVFKDPTTLVQLPNGNDGFPADVGSFHYHGIRGSKLAHHAVVSYLFGASSPPSPEVFLRRVEKTKFEKYTDGSRSRPNIRSIPFPVTEFGTLGGHATAFLIELAKQAAASKGMYVGKLLASWHRKVSLAVHVAHADNVLRGLSAAVDCVEAAFSSAGMPSLAKALFTRAMGRKRPRASSSGARGAAYRLHVLHSRRCLGVSLVQSARFMHNVVLPFAVLLIP